MGSNVNADDGDEFGTSIVLTDNAAARQPRRAGAMDVQASEHVACVLASRLKVRHLHQNHTCLIVLASRGNEGIVRILSRRRDDLMGTGYTHSHRFVCEHVFLLDDLKLWELL
jgi:hypothetical protein